MFLEDKKKRKSAILLTVQGDYKPAFSIQFTGSNEAECLYHTQADLCHYSDIHLKYINDCTFKVPINSDCQGLVCFCVRIFYPLLSAQNMTFDTIL